MIENAQINDSARNFVAGLSSKQIVEYSEKSEEYLASVALASGHFSDKKFSRGDVGFAVKTYVDYESKHVHPHAKNPKRI